MYQKDLKYLEELINKKYIGVYKVGYCWLRIEKLVLEEDRLLTIIYSITTPPYLLLNSDLEVLPKQREISQGLKNYFNLQKLVWMDKEFIDKPKFTK